MVSAQGKLCHTQGPPPAEAAEEFGGQQESVLTESPNLYAEKRWMGTQEEQGEGFTAQGLPGKIAEAIGSESRVDEKPILQVYPHFLQDILILFLKFVVYRKFKCDGTPQISIC